MAVEQTKPKLVASSLSLLGPTTLLILGLPAEAWVMLAKACGYNGGLEWRPINSLAEAQIQSGLISKFAKKRIVSAEQSPRGEGRDFLKISKGIKGTIDGWREASSDQNKNLARGFLFSLPHRTDSLNNLIKLQELVGEIPFTVYPARDDEEDRLHERLARKLIQPGLELVDRYKIRSFDQLVKFYADHSQYKINLDLAHYLRLDQRFSLPSVREAASTMVEFTEEIQYSANRTDLDRNNQRTKQAMKYLQTGEGESDETRLFLAMHEEGYKGPIVPEFSPFTGTGLNSIRTHRAANRNIRKLLAA